MSKSKLLELDEEMTSPQDLMNFHVKRLVFLSCRKKPRTKKILIHAKLLQHLCNKNYGFYCVLLKDSFNGKLKDTPRRVTKVCKGFNVNI